MKKALSLLLTFALVACIFSSTSLYSASAYEETSREGEYDEDISEHMFKADTRYLDSLQLTDSQLQLDTATLLDLVLNSGLINPLYSEEPGFTEYTSLVNSYNGLQELEKRTDAGTVMVQRYMEESLKKSSGFKIIKLEALLIQDVYRSKLSVKEINSIRVAYECYNKQMLFPDVTIMSTSSTFTIGKIKYTTNGYVQTVSGTNVQSWLAERELYQDEIDIFNETITDYAPYGVTRLAPPTSKYNCHSYAWHSNSTSNTKWIRNSGAVSYIVDPACILKSVSTAQPYDTIVYFKSSGDAVHSGIVKSVSSNGTLTIRSK